MNHMVEIWFDPGPCAAVSDFPCRSLSRGELASVGPSMLRRARLDAADRCMEGSGQPQRCAFNRGGPGSTPSVADRQARAGLSAARSIAAGQTRRRWSQSGRLGLASALRARSGLARLDAVGRGAAGSAELASALHARLQRARLDAGGHGAAVLVWP